MTVYGLLVLKLPYLSLTLFSPREKAHKAATLLFHFVMSLAATLAVFQLPHPGSFLSFFTVLLHVVLGLPLALLPSGCHPSAVLQSSPPLLRMCPSQFHLLLMSQLMYSVEISPSLFRLGYYVAILSSEVFSSILFVSKFHASFKNYYFSFSSIVMRVNNFD